MSNKSIPQSYGLDIAARLDGAASQWTQALASLSRSLRVSLPCIVVSFDPVKQTVVAQPAASDVLRVSGVPTVMELPPLHDVPVVLPRAGTFTLTMPVQPGDECLVVFGDTCIDAWHRSGGYVGVFDQRRHNLSDGFAILGPWSQPRVLSNYSTSSAQLRNDDGTVTVDVAASQVTVTAPTCVVNASGTATVQGSTVNVTASSQVNISGAGHTSIEGKDWLTHKHSGVQSGGSASGPVV